MKKTVVILTAIAILASLSACGTGSTFFRSEGKHAFSMPDFEDHKDTLSKQYAFSDDTSGELKYSAEKLRAFQDSVMSCQPDYGYDELFNYEEAIARRKDGYTVSNHAFSALDAQGKLRKEHLFDVVKKNSQEYLKIKNTSILKEVPDEVLTRVCEILTETTNGILSQYPDIDKNRVYCNLGNLKVVVKGSALDFAAVEPEMVLHINPSTSSMATLSTSSNMYNVLVHETMHIIQYGCSCEEIEGCIRRCGLSYAYPDEEQDYSDWTWLFEGSAERMANLYTNTEAMTYKNMVNYMVTIDLATMLQEDIPANYLETVCFHNSLDRLFTLFDAKTDSEKTEVYKMIYSLEIMQMAPDDVQEAYKKHYGTEWTNEIYDEINHTVKRPILQMLTKHFYKNLADTIASQPLTKNDVLFLLNLYESTVNYHILLDSTKQEAYNKEFIKWYSGIQSEFFACLENVSYADYEAYVAHDGVSKIYAGLKWLDSAKQDFLIYKFQSNLCDYKFLQNRS